MLIGGTLVAVLPHLVLEALAYVTAVRKLDPSYHELDSFLRTPWQVCQCPEPSGCERRSSFPDLCIDGGFASESALSLRR